MNFIFKVLLLLLYMGESTCRKRKDFQQLLRRNKEKQSMVKVSNVQAETRKKGEIFRNKRKSFNNRKEGDLQEDNQDLELEESNNAMSRRTGYHRFDNKNEFYRFREQEEKHAFLEDGHDWMYWVDGTTTFKDMSLPGTHNTMAFQDFTHINTAARCQSTTLKAQLESGIRALDIRCKTKTADWCYLYHGDSDLGFTLGKHVLDVIKVFLTENPSEFIFMRVKSEGGVDDIDYVWSRYLNHEKYGPLFYVPPEDFRGETFSNVHFNNPELSQLRGKIAWIRNNSCWAVPCSPEELQDVHAIGNYHHLYEDKWEPVKEFLTKSKNSRDLPDENTHNVVYHNGNENKLYVNFLSASEGHFPWWFASGKTTAYEDSGWMRTGLTSLLTKWPDFPRSGGSIMYKGINYLFGERLNTLAKASSRVYTGIVYADFPGRDLINLIIQQNMVYEPASTIRFTIDCHHDFAGKEYTFSKIYIRFKNKYNQILHEHVYPKGIQSCGNKKYITMDARKCPYISGQNDRCEIVYVELRTYGSDAFLIDQAWIKEVKMYARDDIEHKFGHDDGDHWWCLSKDHNEWKGSEKKKCWHILRFYYRDQGSFYKKHIPYGWQS